MGVGPSAGQNSAEEAERPVLDFRAAAAAKKRFWVLSGRRYHGYGVTERTLMKSLDVDTLGASKPPEVNENQDVWTVLIRPVGSDPARKLRR